MIIRAWFFKILKANLHKLESYPSNDSDASAVAAFTRKKTDLLNAARFPFLLSFLLNNEAVEIWGFKQKNHCYSDLFEEKTENKELTT